MTIICLGLGVLLSATGGSRAQLPPPPSGTEMLTLVKAPRSLLDIFANIKVALDRGLMLDAEFFSDAVLKHYFGGQRISRVQGENFRRVEINAFQRFVEDLRIGNNRIGGMSVHFLMPAEMDRKYEVSFSVTVHPETGLRLADIERIFGRDWVRPLDAPPPLHGPTNYMSIFYQIRSDAYPWDGSFEFRDHGKGGVGNVYLTLLAPRKLGP